MSKKQVWNRKELVLDKADELVLKADILAHQSKYEEANQYYDKALEIVPGNADVWAFKGITLEGGLKKEDEAMRCWQKAKQLDHDIADAVDMSEEEEKEKEVEIEGIDLNSIHGGCRDKILRLMMKSKNQNK
ncbi:MAG TPA: tetratricopeptide repeat protein [Methanoregulaceae archaeon]|nr:tetratricopeptide repeat protein [Methanoregulaceae archaeon]